MNDFFLSVGSSPHIKNRQTTQNIMADVLIALSPAVLMALIYFKLPALWLLAACIGVAVLSEYLWNYFMKLPQTVGDLSAVVTGALLALNLSPLTPFWAGAIGSFFAIIIVKMLFGGIGHNFVNPALAARAFLMASWPVQMTTFPGLDAKTGATQLASLKLGNPLPYTSMQLFLGHNGGCLGEVSALALLIGAAYLLIRRVIRWEVPVIFILSTGILTTAFSKQGFMQGDFLLQILSGGLILGACFMANDYTTSPMTRKGKIIYALGCGFMTFVIRSIGGYPEGVSYSILLMNLLVPLLDRWTIPKTFGEEKQHGKKDVKQSA